MKRDLNHHILLQSVPLREDYDNHFKVFCMVNIYQGHNHDPRRKTRTLGLHHLFRVHWPCFRHIHVFPKKGILHLQVIYGDFFQVLHTKDVYEFLGHGLWENPRVLIHTNYLYKSWALHGVLYHYIDPTRETFWIQVGHGHHSIV